VVFGVLKGTSAMTREVLEKTLQLATAAFGLVAALAWNDAIQTLFTQVFGEAADITAKFIYAILVTGVVVFATIRLARLQERVTKQEEQEQQS
jgi:TRAP-type C4-dicarboxylate transport system permease small subunit